MVRTVEQLTDVRIDHVAVVDWHGLVTLIDSLGGLELTFADTTVARDRVWGPERTSCQELRYVTMSPSD